MFWVKLIFWLKWILSDWNNNFVIFVCKCSKIWSRWSQHLEIISHLAGCTLYRTRWRGWRESGICRDEHNNTRHAQATVCTCSQWEIFRNNTRNGEKTRTRSNHKSTKHLQINIVEYQRLYQIFRNWWQTKQGSKRIRQWPINWCTFPMMIHKIIPFVHYT